MTTIIIETQKFITRRNGLGYLETWETHWFGTLSARYMVAIERAPEWDL